MASKPADWPAIPWEDQEDLFDEEGDFVDDFRAKAMVSRNAAPSSSSASRRPPGGVGCGVPQAESESWKRACHHKYFMKRCHLALCQCRHDLSEEELKKFYRWADKDSIHVVNYTESDVGSFSASTLTAQESSRGTLATGMEGASCSSLVLEQTASSASRGSLVLERTGSPRRSSKDGPASRIVRDCWVDVADDEEDEEEGEEGEAAYASPPSKGSEAHASGSCKPCIFVPSANGCKDGADCRFCHYDHSGSQSKPKKKRPCKSMRASYRKLLSEAGQKPGGAKMSL